MKTYSVAIKTQKGYWVTNISKFSSLDEIDWDDVAAVCHLRSDIAFGYYYGHKSNELTSSQCRTELAYILN